MSLVVRASRISDSEKPNYTAPSDTELIFQTRATRSQNIETHYNLSPVSKSVDFNPVKPTAPTPTSFCASDDTFRKSLEHSGSENSLSHDTEVFDLGYVLLTLDKHAETVYVDTALKAPTIPISAPTSQLIYSALYASLPSNESSAASINSSTDSSDSDSDSNSDMADINPP